MHSITLSVHNMIIGTLAPPLPPVPHTLANIMSLVASLDSYEICPCRPTPCCNGFYRGY